MVVGKTFLNYRITEKLGAGGQGTVYKAVDERLGRTVVIKVLSPELTAREVNLKRFQREAQLASSLDHPNICTIYGLHETDDGLHFIAMQYIEGKNVRQLVNGRPLSLETALSIAYQVSDALTAAHSKGIIHRDIKAGNVMVTDAGLVKVLDFGLAKLLDDGGKKGGDVHLTELGVPYGTATYAAPEQASGLKVDHRADIFSTGVLLYEMLAGIWPFKGQTTVEVRYAVLHDTPEPVNEVRRDDPPESIQHILDRSLAKKPDERYQRIAEMRDDLRAAMREVSARAGAQGTSTTDAQAEFVPAVSPPRHQPGTGGGFGHTFRRWWRSLTGAEAQPTSMPPSSRHTSGQRTPTTAQSQSQGPHVSQFETEKSIAILPFRNLSNDSEASFYEFSLADAVITELARNRSLIVRPSSMIVKYQGTQVDAQQAGRDLNVSAVLVAGFLRSGGALRVNAQLVDVFSGEMIWSDRIDANAADIIALQDTIAQRIAQGLNAEQPVATDAPQSQPATTNAQAYEEYLRGRDFFAKFLFHTLDDADCDRAVEHFQHAIRLDPSFALAHSGLGACFANRVLKGLGGADDYELAENAFSHALELDPDIIEARILMVFIYLSRGEKEKARAEVARLSKQAPNEPAVYFVKGALHRLDGEYERAHRAFDKLSRLDPAARVVASYNRARVFMYQHRFDDALLELQQGARVEPNHPLIRTFQAVVLGRRGDPAEAVRVLRDVLEEHPTMDGIRPLLAQQLIKVGDTEAAREQLTDRVREAADADHDIAYWLATTYAMLGSRDEAFRWLGRAIDLGNENRTWFESDPNWEQLRGDERFAELMRRIEREKARAAPREQSLTETPDAGRSTTNPEAYEEYLRGRDASGRFIYHTLAREDSDASVAYFRRAVELDPNFALAWCALGGAYANRVIKGLGNNEDYAQAEAAFEKALALDPRLLEARLHTVFVKLARGDKAGARSLVEELKSEAPNEVGVHFVSATIARLDGRYDDALEGFGRMLRINPAERVVVSYNRARVLMYQRRFDDALAELELGAQMEHDHPLVRTFRAVLSARKGDAAGALKIIGDVLKRNPRMDGVRPLLAQFLAQRGDKDAARAELTEAVRDAADADHDVAYWLATAYAVIGERDEAFRWLERAIKLGNENRPWFESDPNWEALREDPRFGELMSGIETPPGRAQTEGVKGEE
ncbi:MAG TPA: tetratricopeptide repeat protein [Pyrinomonadaceae bacterium]|jgi:serine/threonine-protein kinase|nr:tetratricopeptide repeat protein [Pyrinomonadaceae bacterium]